MRLYLLPLGRVLPYGAPIPGYLIQTDDGTNVLVDTGLPYSFIAQPPQVPGIAFEMHEEDWVVNRLAALGLRSDDIHYLVCTHLDADHAGNNDRFPAAEIIVQRTNYDLATAGHPRFGIIRAHWDTPGLRYRPIDGDQELLPGIELIETGGHVPGHQSVLVRLPKTGPVLLAIDAVPHHLMRDAETRAIHFTDMEENGTRASTRKLAEVVERERVTLTVYGHDAAQWATLKHTPEFYE